MVGVILAGGQGTRLGPLGLQRSKALVTVGNKPIFVHQYQQLKYLGCKSVVIVVSPRTRDQVEQVLRASGVRCRVAVQRTAEGPAHAILAGVHDAADDEICVMFADTYIKDNADLPRSGEICVSKSPFSRKFCWWEARLNRWREEYLEAGAAPVSIGCFRAPTAELERACWVAHDWGTMNGVLNSLSLTLRDTPSWRDAGDVKALTELNREVFISRDFNNLSLDENGIITKRGKVVDEANWLRVVDGRRGAFYPRTYGLHWKEDGTDEYQMEYVPLPTLAELYLYWPREPSMWTHITQTLVDRMQDHWHAEAGDGCGGERERARLVYIDGIVNRYRDVSYSGTYEVNGDKVVCGEPLLTTMHIVGSELAGSAKNFGWLHGDPNFTNVLWSLETSTFRLIDPRGAWGKTWPWGDTRYDRAKIAYSPIFSRVAHGLFEMYQKDNVVEMTPLELDPVITEIAFGDEDSVLMQKLVALVLLAGAPLHNGQERDALFFTGAKMMQEWM